MKTVYSQKYRQKIADWGVGIDTSAMEIEARELHDDQLAQKVMEVQSGLATQEPGSRLHSIMSERLRILEEEQGRRDAAVTEGPTPGGGSFVSNARPREERMRETRQFRV